MADNSNAFTQSSLHLEEDTTVHVNIVDTRLPIGTLQKIRNQVRINSKLVNHPAIIQTNDVINIDASSSAELELSNSFSSCGNVIFTIKEQGMLSGFSGACSYVMNTQHSRISIAESTSYEIIATNQRTIVSVTRGEAIVTRTNNLEESVSITAGSRFLISDVVPLGTILPRSFSVGDLAALEKWESQHAQKTGSRGNNTNINPTHLEDSAGHKWEIPRWTSRLLLPDKLLISGTQNFGEIFDQLSMALRNADMLDWSAYTLSQNGFALITKLEQIDENGSRIKNIDLRMLSGEPDTLNILSYIKTLFKTKPGRFRFILFVVSDQPVHTSMNDPRAKTMNLILKSGAMTLPSGERDKVTTPDTKCVAFIYEFVRQDSTSAPKFIEHSELEAIDHLGATYWEKGTLKGPR